MDKSRGAFKVPRRASQENQAPTLIIVKDFNSGCFIDIAEQMDKTNVLGSLLFCSQRQNIFLFKQSHHSSWCSPGYTHADREPQACVMWHQKWTEECTGAHSPASASNGTWGKLLALSKSLHLNWCNLVIIVKIKAISQGFCETQILRCSKALVKVSKTCMGFLGEWADPRYSILFLLVFSF